MATSHPPFASSEYVKRWLAEIESKPSDDVWTQIRDQRHSKRRRSPSQCQNPQPVVHTPPHKRRKRVSVRRSRSPRLRNVQCTDQNGGSEDNEEQEASRSVWSDVPANLFAEDHASTNSRSQQIAPEDPSEKYSRRPRHKTKVDRYEYKGDVIRKSPVKTAMKRRHKRSRRKNTGDMLNQEFKAPNVKQDRLTLKASFGPGIFGKGRASTLLQTRGLPDLTFSEMNFLRKRMQPDLAQPGRQKQSNATKKKDRSKEISGFFANAQSEAARPRRTSSEVNQRQYSMGPTEWENSPAISSPAKLPSSPELSLVSEILSSPGRHSKWAKQLPRPIDYNANGNFGPSNQQWKSELAPARFTDKSVVIATTSCSWSVKSFRPGSREQPANRLTDAEQVLPLSAQQSKMIPTPGSSITNSSLDRYTKNLLLPTNDEMWRQSHQAPLNQNVFSLDDLKGLARIAEIEERYRGLPGMNLQHKIHPEPGHCAIAPDASAAYCGQPEFGHGKSPATFQLPKGNFTAEPMNQTFRATLGGLPPSPLHLRANQQYQALPKTTATRGSVSAQGEIYAVQHDPAHLEQARHRNRPSHISDSHFGHTQGDPYHKQQLYYTQQHQVRAPTHLNMIPELDIGAFGEHHGQDVHNEQSHIYLDTAQETFGPAMAMLPAVGVLGLEDCTSDNLEPLNTLPELCGLLHGEHMEHRMESCGQGSEMQLLDYDDGQADLHIGDTCQNSAEQHISDDGGEKASAWKRHLAQHPFERPEEEFHGLSRPQILY